MIDVHCHLLPGIDDGADTIAQSLAMARMALANGFTHVVCTPHMHAGRYTNTKSSIAEAVDGFRRELSAGGISLSVAAAAEVRFDMEIMLWCEKGELPFLGRWEDKDVLLLEFPHGGVPFGAERLTQWLIDKGVVPLIAHPERNKGVMNSPSRLKTFIGQGCLLQVTAGSLVGRFGARAQEVAEQLVLDEVVTVLATDAHNLLHRPPAMSECLAAVASLVGDTRARELTSVMPWKIVESKFG